MRQKKPLKNSQPVVAVFAHPDDESFGPSGTLAKLSRERDVYLICATLGELGRGNPKQRERELKKAAKIIGIKQVFLLGFKDGTLSNSLYHKLADKIEAHLKDLKPQTIITYEHLGISGHLDHIAVSMVSTFVFERLPFIKTLMFYCIDEKTSKKMKDYFIYFPTGYKRSIVDKIVDVSEYWAIKKEAMFAHESQKKDAMQILDNAKNMPKEEYFLIKKK